MERTKRSYISAVIAITLLLCAIFAQDIGHLTTEMVQILLVIVCVLVLWIVKPIPIAISSLVILTFLPVIGLVDNMNEAFAGFSNATNFFIIASFGLSLAIKKSSISNRILAKLLAYSRGKTSRVILAYMLMVYILSCFMSDIPAIMIGIVFGHKLLDSIDKNIRFKIGKTLMLSLPFASIIGGFTTPVGSSINLLALNLLESNTGLTVTFLQWCIFCAPVSLLLLIAAWKILVSLYKAPDLTESQFNTFMQNISLPAGADAKKDRYVGIIILAMTVAWFSNSWIASINTTMVAIIGLMFLMLPNVGVFDWKEFSANVPWEIFFLGGTAITLSNLTRSTGIVQLAAEFLQPGLAGISPAAFIILLGVIVTLILILMPIGTAVVSMLLAPVFFMVEAIGLNPIMAVIALAVFSSNSSIVPLNSVMILSFGTGYWEIGNLARAGLIITTVWLLLAALWFPIAAGLIL